MHGHTRELECCLRPSACPAGQASVQQPSHYLGPGPGTTPVPAAGLNPEPTCALLFHRTVVRNTLVNPPPIWQEAGLHPFALLRPTVPCKFGPDAPQEDEFP